MFIVSFSGVQVSQGIVEQSFVSHGDFVVRSPEVGLSIISFRHPLGLLVLNFGRQRANRRRLFT